MTTPAPKNGCHDRAPYRKSVPVQDGWFMDGVTRTPRMVSIPAVMAADCRYTHSGLGQADSRCVGCKWRTDVAPKAVAA